MIQNKKLDVICIGRAGVDLYGDQVGGRLEDMASFSKYVGGCPANIAIAGARLGLKTAMVTRVGDDHMGRFIRETLEAEGVDVSGVKTDPARLTGLVILGIRDSETFPLIFYRENCADMALAEEDLDEDFIASAKAILITGTHLSKPGPLAATRAAMEMARRHGVKVVLDIDYRPVLWGLTAPDAGEQRYVANDSVSRLIQDIARGCDVIVGTEEEFHIAGGLSDTVPALRHLREITAAVFVLKLGPGGCAIFSGAIPDVIDESFIVPGFPVDVYNVLGAGDAFLGGLLRGHLRGESWTEAARMGNAAGAIVVSRHGCAPATPSLEELQHFMTEGSRHFRLREDQAFEQLHWSTTRRKAYGEVLAFAFDHRSQLEALAAQHGRDAAAIGKFKALCWEAAERAADAFPQNGLGILCDGRLGEVALNRATGAAAERNIWIGRPIEKPGSRPVEFEGLPSVAQTLREWPIDHCVKCLVLHHPDDAPEPRREQEDKLLRLAAACRGTRHELLIEIITPAGMARTETTIPEIIRRFYQIGIYPDWWKLPAPVSDNEWSALSAVIAEYDPHCRGIVLLGLDAPLSEVRGAVENAARYGICRGFAVGRTIFGEAARAWFAGKLTDDAAVQDMAATYGRLIKAWNRGRAMVQAIERSAE